MKLFSGKYLLVLLYAIVLSSCGTQGEHNNQKTENQNTVNKPTFEALQRQWMIVELGSFPKDTLIQYKAEFQFSDKSSIMANLGCNQINYQINLDIDSQSFTTKDGAMTRMLCQGMPDSLERYFVNQFSNKKISYILDGHHIILSADNKQILSAIAADWD